MKLKAKPYIHPFVNVIILLIGISRTLLGQANNGTITTYKPTKINYSIYQLKAEISLGKKSKEVGFCYADHPFATIEDGKIICLQSNEDYSISAIIGQNQLKKGKTYYVRAFSKVGKSILYGNEEIISLNQQLLEIGQNAFGGIIAYIFEPQDPLFIKGEVHGIVAAESDLTETYAWNTTIEIDKKESVISLTKQLEDGIGNGKANTRTIDSEIQNRIKELKINGQVRSINQAAAEICTNLKLNSFSDWFLPSLKEMEIMWFHQTTVLNLDRKKIYWTSTSYNPNKAIVFAFRDTPLIKEVKQELKYNIRPMRYF